MKCANPLLYMLLPFSITAATAQPICSLPASNKMPERVISLNQFATENMLLLGLQDRLVATAYPDDEYHPKLKPLLDGIPELSRRWPSKEQILLTEPDFIYAGFQSAFTAGVLGSQQHWQQWGIGTLISHSYCHRYDRPLQWPDIWTDIGQLADLFQRRPQLDALRRDTEQRLADLAAVPKYRVLHLDSSGELARVSGGLGATDLMIRMAGGENVAAAMAQHWGTWSWEAVIEADPQVISIAVSQSSNPDDTILFLKSHPALKYLDAVKHNRFVAIPFTDAVASPRLADGIVRLNQAFTQFQK